MTHSKAPKDLGLKVVSKEVAYWIRVKEAAEKQIVEYGEALTLQTAVKEMAERKIKETKDD